jgi:uncharacterized protein (DUF885 family)
MLGRIEIMRLRDEARRTLGPRFTLPDFHDRVLEDGALTLPMLRTKVSAGSHATRRPPARVHRPRRRGAP